MPTNALAPQVTGVNRLFDWVAQHLPADKFPTSGRTFLETVQGNRTPITESHFSPEELAALKQLVMLKGGDSGSIQYKDYGLLGKAMRDQGHLPVSLSPSLLSPLDALGNIQTTLGRFNYAKDKEGNLVISDSYDFNPASVDNRGLKSNGELVAASGPYAWVRNYAGEKVPPGYGRNVKINLGK